MSAPPKRLRRPGGGGADLSWQASDRKHHYPEMAETATWSALAVPGPILTRHWFRDGEVLA